MLNVWGVQFDVMSERTLRMSMWVPTGTLDSGQTGQCLHNAYACLSPLEKIQYENCMLLRVPLALSSAENAEDCTVSTVCNVMLEDLYRSLVLGVQEGFTRVLWSTGWSPTLM